MLWRRIVLLESPGQVIFDASEDSFSESALIQPVRSRYYFLDLDITSLRNNLPAPALSGHSVSS